MKRVQTMAIEVAVELGRSSGVRALAVVATLLGAGCVGQVADVRPGDDPDDFAGADAGVDDGDEPDGGDVIELEPAGWTLGESDVGLASLGTSCEELPLYNGPTPVSGATLSGVRYVGTLGSGITLDGSCLVGTFGYGASDMVVRNSDIIGPADPDTNVRAIEAGFGNVSVQNSVIRNVDVGIRFDLVALNEDYQVLVEDSIIMSRGIGISSLEHLGKNGNSVSAIIRGNYVRADDSAISLNTAYESIENVHIERNLVDSADSQITLEATSAKTITGVTSMDNRFTGGGVRDINQPFATWDENYLYDPDGEDGQGASLPTP